MKAEEFLRSATEMYREQVAGGGVPIDVPELGLPTFYVFPPQPEEVQFLYQDLDEIQIDFMLAIRMIGARAKTEKGRPFFDTPKERDEMMRLMKKQMPVEFTNLVAQDIVQKIEAAYPTVSLADAEGNSEATTS